MFSIIILWVGWAIFSYIKCMSLIYDFLPFFNKTFIPTINLFKLRYLKTLLSFISQFFNIFFDRLIDFLPLENFFLTIKFPPVKLAKQPCGSLMSRRWMCYAA